YIPGRSLRSSNQGLLIIPHLRLKTKGDRAFEVAAPTAPTLWNSLPPSLRSVDSVDSFKKEVKIHLFIIYLYFIYLHISWVACYFHLYVFCIVVF
ncbi:hypothetical protein LDENG_00121230, partial [Lucifuga dentata]